MLSDKFYLFISSLHVHVRYQIGAQHCFCSLLHLEFVRKRRLWLFQN